MKRTISLLCALVLALGLLALPAATLGEDAVVPTQIEATTDAAKPKAPKGIEAVSTGAKQITLTWKKVAGAKAYIVYRSEKADSGFTKIGTAKKLTFVDKTAKAGTRYYYSIMVKTGGGTSALSKAVAAVALKKPVLTIEKGTGSKVKLSWTKVPQATGYDIYVQNGDLGFKKVKTVGASKLSYTYAGETPRYYTFYVVPVKKIGKVRYLGTPSAKKALSVPLKNGPVTLTLDKSNLSVSITVKEGLTESFVNTWESFFWEPTNQWMRNQTNRFTASVEFNDGQRGYNLSVNNWLSMDDYVTTEVKELWLRINIYRKLNGVNGPGDVSEVVNPASFVSIKRSGDTITFVIARKVKNVKAEDGEVFDIDLNNIQYRRGGYHQQNPSGDYDSGWLGD